jgi:hypothetical protein
MSDDHMLEEHRATWRGFCKLIIWSLAAIVVTLVAMGIFLYP